MPKVVFVLDDRAIDWNARLVTGDAVPEITRLKTEDGGPMDVAAPPSPRRLRNGRAS